MDWAWNMGAFRRAGDVLYLDLGSSYTGFIGKKKPNCTLKSKHFTVFVVKSICTKENKTKTKLQK